MGQYEDLSQNGEFSGSLAKYVIEHILKPNSAIFFILQSDTGLLENGKMGGTLHIVFPFFLESWACWNRLIKKFLDKHPCPFLDAAPMSSGTLRGYLMGKKDGERPFHLHSVWHGLEKLSDRAISNLLSPGIAGIDRVLAYQCVFRATTVRVADEVLAEEPIMKEVENMEEDELEELRNSNVSESVFRARVKFTRRGTDYNVEELYDLLERERERLSQDNSNDFSHFVDSLTPIIVEYLNCHVAFINQSSKPLYVYKIYDVKRRVRFFHSSREGAKARFGTKYEFSTPKKPSKKHRIDIFDVWNSSKDRLHFDKMVNKDKATVEPGELNCWMDYDYTPEICEMFRGHVMKSSCPIVSGGEWSVQTVLDHIYEILCSKNAVLYRYVIQWMAHVVQRPFIKTDVCLIFISDEGVGKDLVFRHILGRIIGPHHFMNTSNVEDVCGNFKNLQGITLLVLDEVDKMDSKELQHIKHEITTDQTRVEFKGMDAYWADSQLNTVMNSNIQSRPILEFSPSNRRFVMSLCDSKINKSPEYFNEFVDYLGFKDGGECAGVKAFGDLLYQVNLANFDTKDIPQTDYMIQMKLSSMSYIHEWWYQCLLAKRLVDGINDEFDNGGVPMPDWENSSVPMARAVLPREYASWIKHTRHQKVKSYAFFVQFSRVCPFQNQKVGSKNGKRELQITIPPLESCRAFFMDAFKIDRLPSITAPTDSDDPMGHQTKIDCHYSQQVSITRAPTFDNIADEPIDQESIGLW